MNKRLFQAIALVTLPLPFGAAYLAGSSIATWVGELVPGVIGAMLVLLVYVLAALGFVTLWAACLLPLRSRAGFAPLAQELAQVRAGGLAAAVEQAKAREHSPDPSVRAAHHFTVAAVSVLFSVIGFALTALLWERGYVWTFALTTLLVCPPLALYHLGRGVMERARG